MSLFHTAFIAAFAASKVAASCAYGTHLLPRAQEGQVPINTFGYSGAIGPASWHLLNTTTNLACATGKNQSPVDMVDGVFTEVPGSSLSVKIPDFTAGATFENLGTTIEIVGEGGTLTLLGKNQTFEFRQFHFHLPSEHLDNGTSMAMEMHMVFASDDAQISVLGVYLDVEETLASADVANEKAAPAKAASEIFETIFSQIDPIATPGTATKTPPFAMSGLVAMLAGTTFKSYSGSLTTPPCSEGVNWFVATDTLAVSLNSYKAVRDIIGHNARFVQNAPGAENLLALSAAGVTSQIIANQH